MIENLVIVDDDPIITEMITELATEKLKIKTFAYASAQAFLREDLERLTCIYLIDCILPDINGLALVKSIRLRDKISPVFMISGLGDQQSIIEGLRSGADDYLVKPLEPEQFLTKIQNARNKADAIIGNMMDVGIRIIPEASLLMKNGVRVGMTIREFQIFQELYKRRGEVLGRQDLLKVLGDDTSERNIDVLIFALRKKLQEINIEIETVRGQGYRIRPSSLSF